MTEIVVCSEMNLCCARLMIVQLEGANRDENLEEDEVVAGRCKGVGDRSRSDGEGRVKTQ